ncbi:MAG: hypothetical protein PHQ43_11050 [Dehalococcoidales bacterium]|nr:hypothetical protein [Dehalococcoidales bacterium]
MAMLILDFTRKVLGPLASQKLERHEITQTLRSPLAKIVLRYQEGRIGIKSAFLVYLNHHQVGTAELESVEPVNYGKLEQADALRGGFADMVELASALHRAGYRFKELDAYRLYRVRFSWRN